MRTGVLVLALLAASCGRPIERDCRVLLPRIEEANASVGLTGNARTDITRLFAMQAARSAAAARWLESATIASDALRRDIPPLVQALRSYAEAAKRADAATHALGVHALDGGATRWPLLAKALAPESKAQPPFVADALSLNERCGFFLADPKTDHPECGALKAVLAHASAPTAGVTTSAHVADCLAELAAIHSTDPRVEGALRSVEAALGEVGAILVAMTVDGPATETVSQLRVIARTAQEEGAAAGEIRRSSAALHAICRAP